MTYRLRTVLWVFALLASSMASFGPLGILFTISVFWFWFLVTKQSATTLFHLLVLIAFTGTAFGVVLPSPKYKSWSGRKSHRKLENIGKSLLAYEKENQGLPDKQWRLALLPYMSAYSPTAQAAQDSITQPQKNSRALSSVGAYDYVCSVDQSSAKHATSYFAVIDNRCAWSMNPESTLSAIRDEPAHSILVIEAHNQNVAWTDSKNLTYDEAFQLLTDPARQTASCHWRDSGFFEKPTWVRNVLFADGSVRSLNMPLPQEMATALLTANGGEPVNSQQLDRISNPELNYKKIYSVALFAVVGLLPAFFLRQSKAAEAKDVAT